MDDVQLIDATLAGNTDAFGQLVRKYQDRLYNALAHAMGSTSDAADVVQETFVQAFVKLESFERRASFFTWLYRIAINRSISLRRRRRPDRSLDRLRDETTLEVTDDALPPDGPMQQRERAAQVQGALATLADEYRQVLILREIEGYDYDTIAQLLDVPVGTVRSRLFRAREQLRERLKTMVMED